MSRPGSRACPCAREFRARKRRRARQSLCWGPRSAVFMSNGADCEPRNTYAWWSSFSRNNAKRQAGT
eukprot:1173138-Prorocentrum_minimum.AAC.2